MNMKILARAVTVILFIMRMMGMAQDSLPDAPSAVAQRSVTVSRKSFCEIAKHYSFCTGLQYTEMTAIRDQREREAQLIPRIILPDRTPVHLRMTETIDSSKTSAGMPIEMQVVEDVKVNDLVVIAKHATAWAVVADQRNHKNVTMTISKDLAKTAWQYIRSSQVSVPSTPSGGTLLIEIEGVAAITGETVHLRGGSSVNGEDVPGWLDTAIEGTGGYAIPLLLFAKGNNAVIAKGSEILAFVDGNVSFNKDLVSRIVPWSEEDRYLADAGRRGKAVVHIYRVAKEGEEPQDPATANANGFTGNFVSTDDGRQWSIAKHKHRFTGKPEVRVDGQKLAKMERATTVTIELEPGDHTFSVDRHETAMTLVTGKEYYVRMYRPGIHADIRGMTAEVGERESYPLEEVSQERVQTLWRRALKQKEVTHE